MRHDRTLEELWAHGRPAEATFSPQQIAHLPASVQRYLSWALAPGAPLATTVRLEMEGELRMNGTWHPLRAEQVLCWERGFVWAAKVWMNGLPVTGFDRLVDDEAQMRWRILGLFPVMRADGAQIARSAAGRLHAETIWMPGSLLSDDVSWTELDGHPHASIRAHGETSEVDFDIDGSGALRGVRLPRWGDPDETDFGYHPFGGLLSGSLTVDGVTLPKEHRVGWFVGTDRFEDDGEFFRCTLTSVRFKT
jgi:hypothetical protein